jgi:hypothetical protein
VTKEGVARGLLRLMIVVAAAGALLGVGYLVYGGVEKPWGPVEAELAYLATRAQRGLSLYVDPFVGAWDMGSPPSRFYVLYTPLWPWLLAQVSPHSLTGVRLVARFASTAAFLASLGVIVCSARRENLLPLLVATGTVLGCDLLVRTASDNSPEAAACACSAFALVRMNKRQGLDALSATLLVMVPLLKPNLIGGLLGAFAAHALVHRRAPRRLVVPALSPGRTATAFALVFAAWSHGTWLRDIVRTSGQPLSLDRWLSEFWSRALFMGAPHFVVAWVAIRRRAQPFVWLPLLTCSLWATFCMAKHGSGTAYWFEPTLAMLVAIAFLPPVPAGTAAQRLVLLVPATVVVLVTVGISIPRLLEAPAAYAAARDKVARIRAATPLSANEVVYPQDSGLQVQLCDRILIPAWQNAYLVRKGTFPIEAWSRDLTRPEVKWLVLDGDYRVPSPEPLPPDAEVSVYRRELRATIEASFVLDREIDGSLLFRRR